VVGTVVRVVVGLALVGLAGIFVMAALRDWRLWTVLRRTAPITPDELAQAARSGRLRGTLVAVQGVARPGPSGPLTSTVNGQVCVWHRHTVHHRRIRRGKDGRARQSLRRRRVADVSSREPVLLAGTAARVELRTHDLPMDKPTRAGVRVLPAQVTQTFPDVDGLMGSDLYVHREWIVHNGAKLYVLAEAIGSGGGIVLRRPAKGPAVVSTRAGAALRRNRLTSAITGFLLTALAVSAAIAVFLFF
jgi:E3 ubiquitin ligase